LINQNSQLVIRNKELEDIIDCVQCKVTTFSGGYPSSSTVEKRQASTVKVMSLMQKIHGDANQDVAAGLGRYLFNHKELHSELVKWLEAKTNYSPVMKSRFPGDRLDLIQTLVELIDEHNGSMNVSGFWRLHAEMEEAIPTPYQITEGRKEAENIGKDVVGCTFNSTSASVDVGKLLDFTQTLGPQLYPIAIPFDATSINRRQSLMAGVRILPTQNCTEKLQSSANVFTFYRGWGGDSKKDQLKFILGPFYHQAVGWCTQHNISCSRLSLSFFSF